MTTTDRTIIRDLAARVAELAARPEQEERAQLWYAQSSLQAPRPLVYCDPEGAWTELVPVESLACEDERARGVERWLRVQIHSQEHFSHDAVCRATSRVAPLAHSTGWGLEPEFHDSTTARGSYVWDSPIQSRADLDRLQTPTTVLDAEATQRAVEFQQELLGDLLQVYVQGFWWWSLGLIEEWTKLRGMNQTFLDMMDEPELVHAGLRRLMEGRLAWLDSLEQQGLLSLNNGNDYVGSGGFGFTHDLPGPDFAGTVRLSDMWGFCEAQNMSAAGPAQLEEFVLRYQLPILERFGLNCYGCCEPLHLHMDMLLARVPRLRRVSISPWANKRICAEKLGNKAIYSWKPNPAYLAGVNFDADLVRRDIRETVDICRDHGCTLEIILKDTHTCNHQPERFDLWTKIAMEEATR